MSRLSLEGKDSCHRFQRFSPLSSENCIFLLKTIFVILLISAAFLSEAIPVHATPSGRNFDNIVTIVMENTGLADICRLSPPPCEGGGESTPYMASLANSYSLALQYTTLSNTKGGNGGQNGTTIHSSLPEYIALTAGQAQSDWSSTDCAPTTPNPPCTAGNTLNMIDSLSSTGLTWAGFAEDYPVSTGCYVGNDTGNFSGRHFPFNYYSDIVGTTRCSNLQRANTATIGLPDTPFINYLNAPSGWANYIWLTPNLCDDGHDHCSQIGSIATSCANPSGGYACEEEAYLKQLVPLILGTTLFTTQRSALFITYDEGGGFCPNFNTGNGDCVYSIFIGSGVKTGYTSANAYYHYSYLATIENNWSLGCLVPGNDCAAPNMSEIFAGTPSFSLTPTIWSCTLINGCSMPFTVTSQGGFTGTVSFSIQFLSSQDTATFSPPTVILNNGAKNSTQMLITGPCFGNSRPQVQASSGGITQVSSGHFSCVI